MSLFTTHDWWTAQPDRYAATQQSKEGEAPASTLFNFVAGDPLQQCGDECDTGCLVVSAGDNGADESQRLITGSFGGYLRVYKPSKSTQQANGSNAQYDINDLLLEQHLPDGAVLQLLEGYFTNNLQRTAIAVLHPQKLVVYTLSSSVSSCELHRVYEHKLPRTAYSMVAGKFGTYRCISI